MTQDKLTPLDLSILKYYKDGKELCGFEDGYDHLCQLNLLNGDLELTHEAIEFINKFDRWDSVISFNNDMYVTIHPQL